MPVGHSGRVVVYLEPELKRKLHARLRSEGRDLKSWLLERIADYLGPSELGEHSPAAAEPLHEELGEVEQRVLDAIPSGPGANRRVDDLVEATGLHIGEIAGALWRLEMQGRVVQQLGLYRRVSPS